MGDRKLKGGLGNALASSLWATLIFIVLPITFILFTVGVIDVAVADLGDDLPEEIKDIIDGFVGGLEDFMMTVIIYAIPIILVALPFGFFKRGSGLRLLFGFLQLPLIALWLYYITNGGVLLVGVTDATIPNLPEDLPLALALSGAVELDMSGLIYVLMAVVFAKGAVHLAEYGGYRGRYLRSRYKGDDDDDYDMPRKKSKKGRKSKGKQQDWEYL